mgnify:CR=1 FL=1
MAEQEEPQLWQTAEPVEFVPHLNERTEAQALLISTRQGAGFVVAAGQLGHAIQSRATHLLMDYSQAACAMRYQIDGDWEQLPPHYESICCGIQIVFVRCLTAVWSGLMRQIAA